MADLGRTSPLRSQTLWHALAYGVSAGAPPTLSFMRPSGPYVGLGYHRRLEEADLDACRHAGLPVYRRMVGGGVVYLDEHQQFFQICLPLAGVPRNREEALRRLLAPAVAAFRAAAASAYAAALGLDPVPGGLTPYEEQRLAELDGCFTSPEWVQGPGRPEPPCRQVKVRAGVWMLCAGSGRARATASVVRGRIERAWVSDPELNGAGRRVEDRLRGMALSAAGDVLEGYGDLAAAFARMRGADR